MLRCDSDDVPTLMMCQLLKALVGLTRRMTTNQIPSGISYRGSELPLSGGVTTKLGLPSLSSGDTLTLWVSNSPTIYTNTGSGWMGSEPNIGFCQGFILNCATSHLWIQTNYP